MEKTVLWLQREDNKNSEGYRDTIPTSGFDVGPEVMTEAEQKSRTWGETGESTDVLRVEKKG